MKQSLTKKIIKNDYHFFKGTKLNDYESKINKDISNSCNFIENISKDKKILSDFEQIKNKFDFDSKINTSDNTIESGGVNEIKDSIIKEIIDDKLTKSFNSGNFSEEIDSNLIIELDTEDTEDDSDDLNGMFGISEIGGINKYLYSFLTLEDGDYKLLIDKENKEISFNVKKDLIHNSIIKSIESNLNKENNFNKDDLNNILSKLDSYTGLDEEVNIIMNYSKDIENDILSLKEQDIIGKTIRNKTSIKNIPLKFNLSEEMMTADELDDKRDQIFPLNTVGGGIYNKININKKNLNSFIKNEKIEIKNEKIEKFKINDKNQVEIFNDKYNRYDINQVLEYKYKNFINPITKEILLSKNIITSLNIEKSIIEDDSLKDILDFINGIKSEELDDDGKIKNPKELDKLLLNYKNIFNKYKDDLFIDVKILTKLEDSINKFGIFAKNMKDFNGINDINEEKSIKLKNQILKEFDNLISTMSETDDYFNNIKNKEVSYIEENIGENGLLRKQFENSNIDYNFTPLSEETLKFILDGFRRHQNLCLIGHSGIGKTHGCKFGAKLLEMPYIQKNGHSDFGVNDLLGTITQNEKGIFELKKGPLIQLVEFGGVLILDEFNAIPQEFLKSLNDLLHRVANRDYGVWNTEIFNQNISVKVNPNFRILFTGNPSSYNREYGNLSPLTTDFLNRVEVKEFPPIELYKESSGLDGSGNEIIEKIKYPMLDTFFEGLNEGDFLSETNKYFGNLKENGDIEEFNIKKSLYLNNLKNNMNAVLTSLLTSLGRGFIDKDSDVNSDLSNFFVLVDEPKGEDSEIFEAIQNVSLSIPNIISRPLKEIIRESKGDYKEDIIKYLESSLSNRIGGENTEKGIKTMKRLKSIIK